MSNNNQGFIQLIVILVLIVIILSLLGVSLAALFQNKVLKDNFSFIGDVFISLWKTWFGDTVRAIWNFLYRFFIDFVWRALNDAVDAVKDGGIPILKKVG